MCPTARRRRRIRSGREERNRFAGHGGLRRFDTHLRSISDTFELVLQGGTENPWLRRDQVMKPN